MNFTELQTPVGEMRAKLCEWLNSSNATFDRLLDWLEGYDLPGVDHNDHTFLWLVRAIPADGNRQIVRTQLAQYVANILTVLRKSGTWERPPMVLTNLLLLSANLRCPQVLAEPLWNTLEELSQQSTFQSHWNETTRVALRSALGTNQIDSRLRDEWVNLIQDNETHVLMRNRFAGWRGLSRMPVDAQTIGKPNMEAIGFGLKYMADYYESNPEKKSHFRKLIGETKSHFGDKLISRELNSQAIKHHWPEWAVQCITLSTAYKVQTGGVEKTVPFAFNKVRYWSEDYGSIAAEFGSLELEKLRHNSADEQLNRPSEEL